MAGKGTLTVRVVGDTKPFENSMSRLGSISRVGFAALSGAAAAGIGGSIAAFASFDSAMTQSLAIMGDVSDEMRTKMSNAAREVAKTTTFSASQAAESYFFLASAGLDAEQSIAALPQVAAFAQAGMFDMATATDLATDAQSALGLGSDDAAQNLENLTRVTDVFVRANTLANTSVEQIAEAMTNGAGASLKILGKDIEEGSAVLAAFADQGVKGAEAGTQFGIVMRDLQTKALQFSGSFEDAGVAVFDASGEMRHMGDIIGDLEGFLDGMSDAEKKSALLGLGFSDKSVKALQTLIGSADAIKEYDAALRDSSGFTENVANKQLETFSAQLGLLKDRLVDVGIEIGSRIVPVLLEFMGRIDPAIETVRTKWNEVWPQVSVVLEQFRDTVERVVNFVRGIFESAGSDTESTGARVQGVLASLQEAFQSAFDAVGAIVETAVVVVTDLWERFGDDIVTFLRETMDNVLDIIDGVLQAVQGVFEVFAGIFTGDWGRVWDGVKMIFGGVWDAIRGIVEQALNWIDTNIQVTLGVISAAWSLAWNAVKTLLSDVWAGISSVVSDKIGELVTLVGGLKDKVLGALSALPGRMILLGQAMIEGLIDGVGLLAQKLKDTVVDVVTAPIDLAKNVLGIDSPSKVFAEIGVNTVRGYIEGLQSEEVALGQAVNDIFSGLVSDTRSLSGAIGAFGSRDDAQDARIKAEDELAGLQQRKRDLPAELAAAQEAFTARKRFDNEMLGLGEKSKEQIELEKELKELRKESETVDADLAKAHDRLEKAQLRVVDAELALIDAGQRLLDLGPGTLDLFRGIAEEAGLSAATIDAMLAKADAVHGGVAPAATAIRGELAGVAAGTAGITIVNNFGDEVLAADGEAIGIAVRDAVRSAVG